MTGGIEDCMVEGLGASLLRASPGPGKVITMREHSPWPRRIGVAIFAVALWIGIAAHWWTPRGLVG
jgi:hypothetical protein